MDQRAGLETEMNSIIARLSRPGGPGISGNLIDSELRVFLEQTLTSALFEGIERSWPSLRTITSISLRASRRLSTPCILADLASCHRSEQLQTQQPAEIKYFRRDL